MNMNANKGAMNMRVDQNRNSHPTCCDAKYSADLSTAPRTPTSGEKVTRDLIELAKYAEELTEFVSNRTSNIVRFDSNNGSAGEHLKAPYYPEYFQILMNQIDRIQNSLYAIRDMVERVDI